MINYLKGKIVSKTDAAPCGCQLVIEVNNIGYSVITNKRTINALSKTHEEAKIYTSLIHKEDTMCLCGFSAREDRDLFKILISVSGIGLRIALMMLDEFPASQLAGVVIKSDVKALSKIKGIGPKLAQRIILELKDKLINWHQHAGGDSSASNTGESAEIKESYFEAESVLLSLGYFKKEIDESLKKALASAENQDDAEELLRHALRVLSS